MNDAPERIWADLRINGFDARSVPASESHHGVYVIPVEHLASAPEVQALVKVAVEAERERCARVVEKRAEDYDREFGIYDYSTGVTEYPGTGSESMEEWESIAAAIRAASVKFADPKSGAETMAQMEERVCSCGAGHGSLEGHTEWCDWVSYLALPAPPTAAIREVKP